MIIFFYAYAPYSYASQDTTKQYEIYFHHDIILSHAHARHTNEFIVLIHVAILCMTTCSDRPMP